MFESQTPLLRMADIEKSYPGVRALDGVDIHLNSGEVLAIIGENGAGKSTLIKTLGGAHQPDSGEILIDGRPLALPSPAAAQRAGIGLIYQEFNLIPHLTVRENIFLGSPIHRLGLVDRGQERRESETLFQKLGMPINPESVVSTLSIAEKQVVEIAKAIRANMRILVMDEPTATLTPVEVQKLFTIVSELKSRGIGIIYISHRLDEIQELADRVVVLRDGQKVGENAAKEIDRQQMIEMMVGRNIEQEYPKEKSSFGDVRLRVEQLHWRQQVRGVSFEVRAGEVLGITGLVGAGRSETARLIAGAEIPERGTILVNGVAQRFRSPADAIRAGICFLTEDRKDQGLVLGHSLTDNFGLPNLKTFSNLGIVRAESEQSAFAIQTEQLQIKASSNRQLAGQLSGGNQQKLVLAKWLERNCNIVIIDEPTRGIDVGAKFEIYRLLNRLAKQGKAIVMISSELPEILGMSDRVLVMREGMVSGEIETPQSATQKEVMELAAH